MTHWRSNKTDWITSLANAQGNKLKGDYLTKLYCMLLLTAIKQQTNKQTQKVIQAVLCKKCGRFSKWFFLSLTLFIPIQWPGKMWKVSFYHVTKKPKPDPNGGSTALKVNSNKKPLPVQIYAIQPRYAVGGRQNIPQEFNTWLSVICETSYLIDTSFFDLTAVYRLLL